MRAVQGRGLGQQVLCGEEVLRREEVAQARAKLHAQCSLAAFTEVTAQHGSLVQSFVRGAELRAYEHHPGGDVVDLRNGSQCFYHCHRAGTAEHGHLHLFWHATAGGRRRYLARETQRWVRTAPTHLIAIGLDARGLPVSMFTVNRWVSDGHWFAASQVLGMLQRFRLQAVPGHEAAGRWLTHFVQMYLPVAQRLLVQRDAHLAALSRTRGLAAVLADKRIEVTSQTRLNWARDLARLDHASAGQRGTRLLATVQS